MGHGVEDQEAGRNPPTARRTVRLKGQTTGDNTKILEDFLEY